MLLDGTNDLGVGLALDFGVAAHDVGLGHLAGAVVGDRDDGAVGHVRVGEEVALQLGRCDLEALDILLDDGSV